MEQLIHFHTYKSYKTFFFFRVKIRKNYSWHYLKWKLEV